MGIDYQIKQGQMVRISINNTPIFTGICADADRNKSHAVGENDGIVMFKYTIKSLKLALQKLTRYLSKKNYSYWQLGLLLLPYDMGITTGNIDTDEDSNGQWENAGKNVAQSYDQISNETGLAWWINTDLELYLVENDDTIEEAPYNLDQDFGTNFEDYRNVKVNGDYSQYANSAEVVGNQYEGVSIEGMQYAHDEHCDVLNICGYYAFCTKVISDNNNYYTPFVKEMDAGSTTGFVVDDYASGQPDIEEGDFVQNRSENSHQFGFVSTITMNSTTSTRFYAYGMEAADGDTLWYNRELNDVLKKEVNSKSAYPPELIKFDTFTPGFLPRQRVYINLPDVESEGYFLINQVQFQDLGNNQFEFTVAGEKRNYSNWITKSDKGYVGFFKNF